MIILFFISNTVCNDTLYIFKEDTLFIKKSDPKNELVEEQNIHGSYSTGMYYSEGSGAIYHSIKLSGKEGIIGIKLDFNGQPSGLYRLEESDFLTLGIEIDRWAQLNMGVIEKNLTGMPVNGIDGTITINEYSISGIYGGGKQRKASEYFLLKKGVYGPYKIGDTYTYETVYLNKEKLTENKDYIVEQGEIWLSSELNFRNTDTLVVIYTIDIYDANFIYGGEINKIGEKDFNLRFYKNNNTYAVNSKINIGSFNSRLDFNRKEKIRGIGEVGITEENAGISFFTTIDTSVLYKDVSGNITGFYGYFSSINYGIFKKDNNYIHTTEYLSEFFNLKINIGDKIDMYSNLRKGIFNLLIVTKDDFHYNNISTTLKKENKGVKVYIVNDSTFTGGISLNYNDLYLNIVNNRKKIDGEIKYSFNKDPFYTEIFIFKKNGFSSLNYNQETEWIGGNIKNSLNTKLLYLNFDFDFRKNDEVTKWNTLSFLTLYPEKNWIITATFNKQDSLVEKKFNITTQIIKTISNNLYIFDKDFIGYKEKGVGISPSFFYFITLSPGIELIRVQKDHLYFNRARFTGTIRWQYNENSIFYTFIIEKDEDRKLKKPYYHNIVLSLKVWDKGVLNLNWTEMKGSYNNRIMDLSFSMQF